MSNVPSYKEFLQENIKANSNTKRELIAEATKKQRKAKTMYERGLLTPLDYASYCYTLWAEYDMELRKDK